MGRFVAIFIANTYHGHHYIMGIMVQTNKRIRIDHKGEN